MNLLVKQFEQQQQQAQTQPGMPAPDQAELRKYALNQLQSMEVLKNAAVNAGLDKDSGSPCFRDLARTDAVNQAQYESTS